MSPSEAISRLADKGLSDSVIAGLVGVNQSTINRIRNGRTNPSYEVGRRLVEMAVFGPAPDPEARDAA